MIDTITRYWHEVGHLNVDQRDYFIEVLHDLKPRFCLEIGFASGRSAITILATSNPEILVSVDMSLDYIKGGRGQAELLQKDFANLKIIEGRSKNILNVSFFQSYFPQGIDFAFIDGGHTYDDCHFDISTIFPYLSQNGVMLVDDYMSDAPNGCSVPDVTKAVDDYVIQNGIFIQRWYMLGKGIAYLRKRLFNDV